jgi:hypothetical protein
MLKQSLVLISITLVLAALLPLTGCSQATDAGETVFGGGDDHSAIGSITPAALQKAVDKARTARQPLIFAAEGTTIEAGPALVDFSDVDVRIEGPVTTSGSRVILNAAKARSLTLTGDGELKLDTADVLIYAAGMDLAKVTPNSRKVLYVPDLADITGSVTGVAVDDFTLTSTVDDDIPVGVSALYVLGKMLVLPDAGTPTTPDIFAVGEVALRGTNTTLSNTKFKFTSTAKITNTTGGQVGATLATGALSIAEIDGGPTITLTGPTSLTLKKLSGTLAVPATTVGITIDGGNGDLVIGDGSADITLDIAFINKSTGKTTFYADSEIAFANANSGVHPGGANITGDVEFVGDVATGNTDGDLQFGGKVILVDGKTITLTKDASKLILDEGAAIYVGQTPLFTALSKTTFTPAEDAVELKVADTGLLTLTKKLTSLTGKAKVMPGATLILAADTELPLAANSSLVFDAEPAITEPPAVAAKPSKLNFAHANSSKLILGGTTITGGNATNTLTANNAAVTFEQNAISGAEGAELASGGGTADVAITVPASGSSLTLDGVNLNLTTVGSLVLTNGSAGVGVILKGGANPGKITLSASGATDITWDTNVAENYLKQSGHGAKITGTAGKAIGAADNTSTAVTSISGGVVTPDNDVKITQKSSNSVTIKTGATLETTE